MLKYGVAVLKDLLLTSGDVFDQGLYRGVIHLTAGSSPLALLFDFLSSKYASLTVQVIESAKGRKLSK